MFWCVRTVYWLTASITIRFLWLGLKWLPGSAESSRGRTMTTQPASASILREFCPLYYLLNAIPAKVLTQNSQMLKQGISMMADRRLHSSTILHDALKFILNSSLNSNWKILYNLDFPKFDWLKKKKKHLKKEKFFCVKNNLFKIYNNNFGGREEHIGRWSSTLYSKRQTLATLLKSWNIKKKLQRQEKRIK